MRIAIAQVSSVPGDLAGTSAHMVETARRAAARGADLVVYPATALGGAYPVGPGASSAYTLDMLAAIERIAEQTPVPAAVPAYIDDGTRPYVEVFVCADSGACPLRQRLAQRDVTGGTVAADVDARWSVDGVDVRFVFDETGLALCDADSDVLLVAPSIPFSDMDATGAGAAGLADSSFAGLVSQAPCWVGVVQGVGAYDDAVFSGGSFAADPDGRLVAVCSSFEEDLAVFDACALGDWAQPSPPREDRGPARVGTLVGNVEELDARARTGLLWRALVVSIRDYVRKSGFSDVLLGLSGGIDSAVVAALAADALGAEHVHVVLMPGPYSSEGSVSDALDLAVRLAVTDVRTVPITGVFEACQSLFESALGSPLEGLARENLQARLRGTILMTLSNATGALVLATGNKSEAGMGYSTLYGDTVGAYAPLCDIYKGRVYDLARWRNASCGTAVIPEAIIEKPPSAELSPDQTDEGSFGATYNEIDKILYMHVERGLGASDIAAAGFDPQTVEHVLDACRRAEYKRRQEPFGPIVSLMPFVDRGWPVVFAWRDKVEPQAPTVGVALDDRGFWSAQAEAPDVFDAELVASDPALRVAAALDSMLVRYVHQEQIVDAVADVAFGAHVSGKGPDMDEIMGIPMFSKN